MALWLPIAAMMAVIGVSNVAVQHAINDWLTWGAFTYPLAFLVTDLTNRAHGPARARAVAYVGLPFGIGLSILLAVAADIPLMGGRARGACFGLRLHLRAALRHRAVSTGSGAASGGGRRWSPRSRPRRWIQRSSSARPSR